MSFPTYPLGNWPTKTVRSSHHISFSLHVFITVHSLHILYVCYIDFMRYSRMLTFADLCRPYSCPGPIVMTAFLHASRFCASFGSSWCRLKSLRTLSIHISMGLPRGLFPPTFIVVTCFATVVPSLLITRPYHERRFWVTYVVIGLTIASVLKFSFLIRSFLVLP